MSNLRIGTYPGIANQKQEDSEQPAGTTAAPMATQPETSK